MSLPGGRITGVDRARVVTNRKSSISLPSGDTACARTPGPAGDRLTKAGDNTLHQPQIAAFAQRVFYLAQS